MDTSLLDGGSNDGAAGGNDGTTGGDAADKCAQLIAQADQALQAAIQCCPTCNVMQCSQQIDGLCCKVSVTNPDSQAVKQYIAAVDAGRAANCQVGCPAIVCPVAASNVCQQDGTCAQF